MTELDELTCNKNIRQLQNLLNYYLDNGESLGGTICSHITNKINEQKRLLSL